MPGALGVLGLLFPELMKTVINVIRAKCHVHTTKRLKDCGKVLRGSTHSHHPAGILMGDPPLFIWRSGHDSINVTASVTIGSLWREIWGWGPNITEQFPTLKPTLTQWVLATHSTGEIWSEWRGLAFPDHHKMKKWIQMMITVNPWTKRPSWAERIY